MVSSSSSHVVGKRLSTVVPANVTGDHKSHHLTHMDLAVKLHYLKGLYVFEASEALQGLTIQDLKEPMFPLLDLFYVASGRIRRSPDSGRPFLKCNDSGIRIVEATSDKTVPEVLRDLEEGCSSLQNDLVYGDVLGPDLSFSPLVFVQFTWFKCGGISIGLNWAHVLGDALSASTFINMWGKLSSGQMPPKSLHVPTPQKSKSSPSIPEKPLYLKRVDPVGDYWITPSNRKMASHTFHITSKQLNHMVPPSIYGVNPNKVSKFESVSAMIWKLLFEIHEDSSLKIVTICGDNSPTTENDFPTNEGVVGVVQVDFSISKCDISNLAMLIATKTIKENEMIKEMLEEDDGRSDFILYGANLTFVNLLNANIYGLELKGEKPIYANYTMDGVGDGGTVLILPYLKYGNKNDESCDDGCIISVILLENVLVELKKKLGGDFNGNEYY